jgi:hypothetical protein
MFMIVVLFVVGLGSTTSSSMHAKNESVTLLRFGSFGEVLKLHGFSLESH